MKPGDLVRLGLNQTMKGRGWEDKTGIVIEITDEAGCPGGAATVNFCGTIVKYAVHRLMVVNELTSGSDHDTG